MFFKQIIDKEGCNSYIVACSRTREAFVVDPSHDLDLYMNIIKENDLKTRFIIDTHTHADHDSLADQLARYTGAEVAMHKNYAEQRKLGEGFSVNRQVAAHLKSNSLIKVDIDLDDEAVLQTGDVTVTVIHTPGHTLDSICLALPERILITGDSVMIGQCGRTDLPGGDSSSLYASLARIIRKMDDNTIICPAHDYKGNINSSLGFERVNNPFLKIKSSEEFVLYAEKAFGAIGDGKIQCSIAPPPEPEPEAGPEPTPMMKQMCAYMEYYLHHLPSHWNVVAANELMDSIKRNENQLVLDVRTPDEFVSGHIPGSVNIPVTELPRRVSEVAQDLDKPVVTVCLTGVRSAYAAMFLRGYGFSHVRSLDLGMHQWNELGQPVVH